MTLSREVRALVAYAASTGLPHRVTSTYRPGDDGRHGRTGTDGWGLAVDFAGPTANDIPTMLAIYRAFLAQADKLHELIFSAPGVDVLVRRRVKVVPMTYGPAVLAAHRNHIHVSVDRGTFLVPPAPEVAPMFDPPLPIAAWCLVDYDGGGLVGVSPRGDVYCEPAGLHRGAPAGKAYWGDRQAARIEQVGDGYRITATTGERYGPGF